jgi:hypothetical protein
MTEYNFLADLLDTFQSMDNAMKALALLIPPAFVLCLLGLLLRHRATLRAIEKGDSGQNALLLKDLYDRIEYLRSASLPVDEREPMYLEPMPTAHRRRE